MPNGNNPYYDILGEQRRGLRRRGQSRFGEIDQKPLDDISDALSTAITGITAKRDAELKRRSEAFESAYIDRRLKRLSGVLSGPSALNDQEVNTVLDDVTIDMLRHGGTRSRQVASDIQRLRRKENVDNSLSPEEAYMRGKISYQELVKIKKAGKDEKATTVNIDRVVGEDGYYYDVVENKQTGQTEYRKSNVKARPLSQGGKDVNFFGQGGSGKRKVNIPFINATKGAKGSLVQIERKTMDLTHDELVDTIETEMERLDSEAQQFHGATGKDSTMGIDWLAKDYKTWDDFKKGEARVDELDPSIQNYAIAWNELRTQQKKLGKNGKGTKQRGSSGDYDWEFED